MLRLHTTRFQARFVSPTRSSWPPATNKIVAGHLDTSEETVKARQKERELRILPSSMVSMDFA